MADDSDTPPFSNVDINKENGDDEDLFASAIQDINEDVNNLEDDLENVTISDRNLRMDLDSINVNQNMHSPIMEEIITERSNNIIITVTEPHKVGEGMGSYVAYRLITKTNMPIFSKQEFSVLRRFSDFLGLHEKLTEKYLRSGRIIPPAPEKNALGTTKLKMTSTPSTESATGPGGVQGEFVERRRAALERYVNRTAQHPVLCIDPDFREFLESDIELPKATSTSALSGAGVLRLFNKVGETVNKITYKMDETDPWFEERHRTVESLEASLRRLAGAAEALATERRELASLAGGAARAAAALSGADPHAPLSRTLSQLAEVHEKVESLRIEQANTDFYVLCEHLKDYIGLIGAIKEAFHERVKVFQNWQHAQMQLTRRRENKAKAELANRPEKVDQAATEIIEWEAKVERGQAEFDTISRMIKKEIERFDVDRVRELKATIVRYLEEHMKHQAQTIRYWDAFLPEARAIK